jgi:Ca2+-binding RTX toxin-like protein
MATTTVASGRKTIKDNTGADTYNISADATSVIIAGKMTSGDVINLEGLASEYTVSASGRTITLKSESQTIKFQLAATSGTASIRFLDGDLTATYSAKGGALLGTQKLTKKAADVSDEALGTTDSTAIDFTTGGSSSGGSSSGTTGSTYALTIDTDTWTGTSGNDTFNASNSAGTAAAQTYNTGDILNGGLGTDTLNATIGAASTFVLSDVQAIEVINGNFTAAGTLSMLGSSGVTNVNSRSSTTAAIFSNIGSTSVQLGVTNSAVGATFGFTTAAVAGTADTVTLNLNNQTGGTNVIADVETLNIVSSTSANTIGTLTTAATTKVVVTGNQDLTVPFGATVATVDASAFTGALSATMGAVAAATITGGAGNDALTITAVTGTVSLNGGAGNDTVTAAAALAITDTLIGGDGTDTLSSTSALVNTAGYATPTTRTISGFETLSISNDLTGAITTVGIDTGIKTLVLASDGANTLGGAITFNTGASTLQIGTIATTAAALGAALTAAATDTTAADGDALTITNGNLSTVDAFAAQNVTTTGYESVTINTGSYTTAVAQSSGTISVTGSSGFTSAETLKIAGANNFTAGAITADIIDASAMTSTTDTTLTTVTGTTATTVTGSGGNDVLIIDGTNNVSVNGGAGNDTITGGAGNDVLLGGTGIDSITAAAGNDTVTAGAGNDTIVFGDNFTTGDVVDGGDGTDTLSLTSATNTGSLNVINGLSFSASTALNAKLTNVERVRISDALVIDSANFDMARLANINYVSFGASAQTAAETITGIAANSTFEFTTAAGTTHDLTLTLSDATGSSDAITLALTNNTDTTNFGDVTIASIETATITTAESTSAANTDLFVFDLTATDLTTLNVTGTEGLNLSGVAINATTINASGNAGSVNILGGSANQTITGTAAADTILGGSGADTISGGAGIDSLVGGSGADSITGGAGIDTITGGAGNDSIVLTESGTSADIVILDWSGATDVDSITGFTAGTGGDVITFDVSELVKISGSGGVHSTATVLANLDDAGAPGTTEGMQVLTAAADAVADDNIFVLAGATFSSTSDVEDALEVGGSRALSAISATLDVQDLFFVVYSDGTDSYIGAARVTIDEDGTTFDAGSLSIVNLAKLVGLSSIGSTTLVDANFNFA